jgi:translation initiation factor 3 subunit I
LFTSSKDSHINAWFTETGVRLGTFHGHNGAIWDVDVDHLTKHLLSASSDSSVKLWDVQTGRELFSWKYRVPVRSVSFSSSQDRFLSVTDNVLSNPATIYIHRLLTDGDPRDQVDDPLSSFICGKFKVTKAVWGPADRHIYAVGDSARVQIWDPAVGKVVHEIDDHEKAINDIEFSSDGAFFLTASSDFTARLYDSRSNKLVNTYRTGRPCNGASFSPKMDHVIIGGGQPASEVTTKRVDPAQFATRIYHKIYAEEMGMIAGHFGTVNAVKFSPTGKQFATGGEDGYVRLNFLDDTYFRGLSDDVWVKALADRLADA